MENNQEEVDIRIIHQSEAYETLFKYAQKRASGEIPTLETCYGSLNRLVDGGFEPNTILTLAGLSGTGKSTLSKRIIYSIVRNYRNKVHDNNEKLLKENPNAITNKHAYPITLCFNFEMLAMRTIGREVANLSKRGLNQLYSRNNQHSDEQKEKNLKNVNYLKSVSKDLKDLPIYYVETSQQSNVIAIVAYNMWKSECKDKKLPLILEVDHSLLIKAEGRDGDKEKIDKLALDMVNLKKRISDEGGMVFIILLSQLNRNLKSPERIATPNLHTPISSDIFQSSSIEFASDYILIAHCPSLLRLPKYTESKLPTTVNCKIISSLDYNAVHPVESKIDKRSLIYFHLIKNRDGAGNKFSAMIGDLEFFNYYEIPPEIFKIMHTNAQNKDKDDTVVSIHEYNNLISGLVEHKLEINN